MRGLEATFATLSATANEAAVPVLLRALDVSQRNIRDLALRTLLHRRSLLAEETLLRRWHQLSEHSRQIIAEKPGWISGAIRKGLIGNEEQLHQNACAAAIATRDFELIPNFAESTCDRSNLFSEMAAATVLRLAEELHEMLVSPRDYRERRDPQSIRSYVLPQLERSLFNTQPEHRQHLAEAFLLIAGREHVGLKKMVEQPDNKVAELILEILATTTRAGILHYILSCLDDPFVPPSIRSICCRRSDITFLRQLCRRIGRDPSKVVRNNLRKMESCAWLDQGLGILEALTDAEQAGAANWAVCCGIERDLAFEVVAYLVRHGGSTARRTAAALLPEFQSMEADELILLAAHDNDPQVRTFAAPLLRQRKIAGGISRLLEMVDSSFEPEQAAARQALEEFRIDHFAEVFDSLPPAARATTGLLVKRIDPQALPRLGEELRAPERARRRKALELVAAMQAIPELHIEVAALLHDEDEFLRADAVRAVAECDIPESRAALRSLLTDTSALVRQAAEEALAKLNKPGERKFPSLATGAGLSDSFPEFGAR